MDKFKKYKQEKEVQKIIDDHQKKYDKRQLVLEQKRQRELEKQQTLINLQYEKKLIREHQKITVKMEDKVREKIWRKKPKRRKPVKKIKWMAYRKFQLYCKLKECDSNWMLVCLDTWKIKHYTEVDWWHYFGKWTRPHLWFIEDNCRPISKDMNKKQWSLEWLHWKNQLIKKIWQWVFDDLEIASKDKKAKSELRWHNFYLQKFEYYNKKCEEMLQKIQNNKK